MAENFDLFSFEHCAGMLALLGDPQTSSVAAGGQLVTNYPNPPGDSCDIGVLSGEIANGGFSTADVRISIEPTSGVGQQWTAEWNVIFEELPPDFSSLVANHIYLGASDASGPVAGLFIAASGVSYTGSVHHVANNLVTDSSLTAIPGTAAYIAVDVPTTFRLAVDAINGVAYLFITDTADILITGHRLVAILPVLNADDMTFPPIDQSFVSVRGTTLLPSRVALDSWRLASTLVVPNLPPIADAGVDQAVRICSIALFDGTASFDPEGEILSYDWRLIAAPLGSVFLFSGDDGVTTPLGPPTGFTDRFHSTGLGVEHALNPLVSGDVLLLDDVVYDIVSTGSDGGGFYALVSEASIPEPQTGRPFRILRQYGISGPTSATPTFLPDVFGFYRFDLTVNDGSLDSQAAVVVINVVDSPLPRGIVPDASFIFDYLSDYWNLLEDREPIATFWSSLAQVAAAELYTLWQHDYSKSLRDIQRTFLRRWLHYDLLLGEPIPELTTLRVFYGGLATSDMAAAGESSVEGTGFVIASPVHDNATITVVSEDPVTAPVLANELLNRLLEVDSRYTTQVITRLSGDQIVRINAPFPFSIVSSTLPVLATGASSLASGSGAALNARTYQVDTSLEGLGIQENDLLVLGDEAFRVSAIANDPADDFPFSRVILKTDIPQTGVAEWTLSGYVRSELLDFYSGLVSFGDLVFFEVVALTEEDETSLVETMAIGVSAEDGSNLAFALNDTLGQAIATPSRFALRLAKVVRRTYLPVDVSVVDIPTLIELIEIVDDEATLRRNLDFFIEEYRGQHCLRFVSGQFGGDDIWEGESPPDRLWAEYTHLDNNPTIEANFGILAEVSIDQIEALPGNVDYLSAVRGIWYAYINGPTMFNLRVGSQILLGLPFAEEAGTIEEIRTDFSPTMGRILIRDTERSEIVRSYTFPRSLDLEVHPTTGLPYAVGDSVTQFAPLVEGVEIVDYVKDPDWFEGLLNQGIFYEVEKYWRFLVRVDSATFSLESLQFVRDFILKIKPTSTYPLFLVQKAVDNETEVSVTDDLRSTINVRLLDTVCGELGAFSTSFDDPRASTGGYWNQFDTDSDDGTPLPTYPAEDVVEWAFDRYLLCPEDLLAAHLCQNFPAPALASTGVNLDDTNDLINDANFVEAGPFTIANGAVGEAITANVGDTVPITGTIERVRLLIAGGPGAAIDLYDLVVAINGVDTLTEAFTSLDGFTHVAFVESQAVTAADVITVFIRHANGAPQSPDWTSVRVDVSINLGAFDSTDLLPVGNYCADRSPL